MLNPAPLKPVSIKKLSPEYDRNAVRERILWGPFRMKSKDVKRTGGFDPGSDTFFGKLGGICGDCVVLRALAAPTWANDTLADLSGGIYVHHLGIGAIGKVHQTQPLRIICNGVDTVGFGIPAPKKPDKNLEGFLNATGVGKILGDKFTGLSMAPFVTNGGESAMVDYMAKGSGVKSGYFLQKNYSHSFHMDLINYDDYEKDVYLSLDIEYVPNHPPGYLSVSQGAMNVDTCGKINFRPPADRAITIQSPEYNVVDNGYLLNLTPHLHDGGIDVKFYKNGQVVCVSNAKYGNDGKARKQVNGEQWETITSYDLCNTPVPIKIGDKVSMSATYDLTKHKLRPSSNEHKDMLKEDSMAFFFFQFAREPGQNS